MSFPSYINKLIFPTKGIDYSSDELNLIWLKNNNNLYFPSHYNQKKNSKLMVLYLHGNGGSLYDFKNIVINYSKWLNSSIFAVEYPGYGLAEGVSSEQSVDDNVETSYYFLRDVLGYPSSNIIIMGYSIGTGAGIKLASDLSLNNNEPGAIILIAAYLSICDIVKDKFKMFNFLSKTIRNRWNSRKSIDSVKCPCMFIHGMLDTIIPPLHSKILFDTCTSSRKRLILIPDADHNRFNEPFDSVTSMIEFIQCNINIDSNMHHIVVPKEYFICPKKIIERKRDSSLNHNIITDLFKEIFQRNF